MRLTKAQAGQFYEVHKERPFYGELTEYMSSGPIAVSYTHLTLPTSDLV